MNSETKTCQNCKQAFTIDPEDFDFYEKIKVPPPTFCPSCREQRRMAIRNERVLYPDICDLCGKKIASMYSPDKPFTVYCRPCWISDKWDAMEYGRDYDWNKPFFVQFRELLEKVPRTAVAQYRNSINSDYANFTIDVKNVYLSFSALYSENIYYGRTVDYSKECFDCFNVTYSEKCYWNVDCQRNFNCRFMVRSRECIDSAFLFDCANCQNCFMSSNLRNRQFVFRNQQLTKEAYKEKMAALNLGSYQQFQQFQKEFADLRANAIHKFANMLKSVDCTGDNIEESKNIKMCFDAYRCQDIKYTTRANDAKDVYDFYGSKAELVYEGIASGFDSFNDRFMTFGDTMKDSDYIDWCSVSTDLLGCIGLRKKSHCILNKQYTKDEWRVMAPKIIKHMNDLPYIDKRGRIYKYGEFFPIELDCFAYNETLAYEHHPLIKEEALRQGYGWRNPDPYPHKPTKQPQDLPDDIKDAPDAIINEVIGCPACGRAYRVIKPELDFLRQHKIALPRACPDCRYKERFEIRNPLKLWHRQCMCLAVGASAKEADYKIHQNTTKHNHHPEGRCPNEFETSYNSDRPEAVYCESCYQKEVV